MRRTTAILLLMAVALTAHATIRVVTTIPDLADFTQQVGGDKVRVDFIVRGDQNPHFVDVKPSYMMKLKRADLFLMVGMELELWAPQIIDGSRNTSLRVVDLSHNISKLEVPTGRIDASQGDVHRFGNPHYWLDPRNIPTVLGDIVAALAAQSPGDEQFFRRNADDYLRKLDAKIRDWEARMKPFAGSRIITFHKSWSYFAEWIGLVVAGYVEPKPGIPPSPSHTAELLRMSKAGNIRAIVVEPFYDLSAPELIARGSGAQVVKLVTSVGGNTAAKDYLGMMEYNISTLEGALR